MADEHRATLTVLHVLTEPAGDESRNRQIALNVEENLRRKLEALFSQHGRTATVHVVTGTRVVEIIRRAWQEAADLILVVGAHGEDFIKDLLLGMTAAKIVRKGDRSVLVVKQVPQRSASGSEGGAPTNEAFMAVLIGVVKRLVEKC